MSRAIDNNIIPFIPDKPIIFYNRQHVANSEMQAGKVDAVAAILQSSSSPAGSSKKELQRMTNFGIRELEEYLKMMEAKDLITTSDSRSGKEMSFIKITERGSKFLELYDTLKVKYLTASSSE